MTWQLFRTLPYEAPSSVTYVHTVIWYIITNPANPPALFQWAYSICFTLGDRPDHQLSIILVDRGGEGDSSWELCNDVFDKTCTKHISLSASTPSPLLHSNCITRHKILHWGRKVARRLALWPHNKKDLSSKALPFKIMYDNNFQSVGMSQITTLCAKHWIFWVHGCVKCIHTKKCPQNGLKRVWNKGHTLGEGFIGDVAKEA